MNKDTTLGLGPEKVARLLGISLDADLDTDKGSPAEVASQLLDAHLAGTLPLDTSVVDELPVLLGKLTGGATPSLGEVLMDANAPLDTIRKIRKHAKAMATRQSSEAQQAVATTIYFAAIANALVFHDRKLTTYSYAALETSLRDLIEKPWMTTDLITLFEQAHKVCDNRKCDLEQATREGD